MESFFESDLARFKASFGESGGGLCERSVGAEVASSGTVGDSDRVSWVIVGIGLRKRTGCVCVTFGSSSSEVDFLICGVDLPLGADHVWSASVPESVPGLADRGVRGPLTVSIFWPHGAMLCIPKSLWVLALAEITGLDCGALSPRPSLVAFVFRSRNSGSCNVGGATTSCCDRL